jgi:hypothetical protein
MTELSVLPVLLSKDANDRPDSRLIPTLIIGGVFAASLMGAALGMQAFGPVREEPPFTWTIGAVAPQTVRIAATTTAGAHPSFAFGFLEFDWNPHAPGGVPGFDAWPRHDPAIGHTSVHH